MTGHLDGCVVALLFPGAHTEAQLRWAVQHASSHDLPLRLVAVVPSPMTDPDTERRLEAAAAFVRQEAPHGDLSVRTTVLDGRDSLVEQVAGAAMVVVDGVGDDDEDELPALLHGEASTGGVPVTVVRGMPDHDALDLAGAVVAGVSTHGDSAPVVGHAFEEASRHGAEVIVTHAWDGWAQDALVGTECDGDGTPCGELVALAEATAGWQEMYPDVVVYRHCVHGDPVDALVRDAQRAQLVVIGGPTGDHVAEVWRRVIHRVPRPVTIIPMPGRSVTPPAPDMRNSVPAAR